jgi:O-antigen ligase
MLFLPYALIRSQGLLLIDVSALIVIIAAVLDVWLRGGRTRQAPAFTFNYVAIILVIFVAGLVAFDPGKMFRPLMRTTVLLATFLSVYRLMRYEDVSRMAKLFYGLGVFHSAIVVGQFLATGGKSRVFGLSSIMFDDLAMLVLPVGVSLYLWSNHRAGKWYLAGSLIVLVALLATQSRAPIVFGLLGSALALVLSFIRSGKVLRNRVELDTETIARSTNVRRRVKFVFAVAVALVFIGLIFQSTQLSGVLGRFEQFLSKRPTGTFAVRLRLWETALMAFRDNPILGVGPGQFPTLREVYGTLHLDPVHVWAHGKSAHSLLFHYLAETGLVGGIVLLVLFFRQFGSALRSWRKNRAVTQLGSRLALFVTAVLFLVTTFAEAGWMWGYTGFIAVFFISMISKDREDPRYTDESIETTR